MSISSQQAQMWENRIKDMASKARQNLDEGAVTESYKANRDEVIHLLNRAIAGEWVAFLQYYHHYFMATDIHSQEIKNIFKKLADEELEHADKIGSRIQLLGGVPADKPEEISKLWPKPVEYGQDLRDMMEVDLVDERTTIELYTEIVRYCGFDDNVTRSMFEEILEDEEEHANIWSDLLYQFNDSTNQQISTIHEDIINKAGGRQQRAA